MRFFDTYREVNEELLRLESINSEGREKGNDTRVIYKYTRRTRTFKELRGKHEHREELRTWWNGVEGVVLSTHFLPRRGGGGGGGAVSF